MPYMTKKNEKEQICVYKKGADGEPEGKTLGCHLTQEKADAQIAAIWASENTAKSFELNEIIREVETAWFQAFEPQSLEAGKERKSWISRTFNDFVIVEREGVLFRYEYRIAQDGSYVWTDPQKVEKQESYYAVKAVGDWELDVLGCPYGGPEGGKDSQGEYFDAATKFHEDKFGLPPAVYYHGFAPDGKPSGDPVFIGKTTSREARTDGIWYRVILDKTNAFAKRVWEAAMNGVARASSGAVSHLVRTDSDGHIRHWPVAELSIFEATEGRRPANAYAVALPAMKAIYQAAGLVLPPEADITVHPQADAKGTQVMGAATAERSKDKSTKAQGAKAMNEEIEAAVAKAMADRDARIKAEAEARVAEQTKIDAAIKAGIEAGLKAREQEAVKAGRPPTAGAPAMLRIPRKYDTLDPADHDLLNCILDNTPQGAKRGWSSMNAREESTKALLAKIIADGGKDSAAHEAIKAMPAGIKTDEIMDSTLSSYGDQWVGVAYATRLWEKIRAASVIVAKIPTVEVPQGMESITIPLESTDPTWYKVAQNNDLPTTEATGWPNATITSSKVTTANTSLTVAKMGARCLWTGEMEEDSLIPWVSNLRNQLTKSGAEQMEYAVIDGDTATTASTNVNDIAGTPGSTDLFMMCVGFRGLAARVNSANARACGTLAVEDYLETLKLMGTAGRNAANFASTGFIIDPWTLYKTLQLAEIETRDVSGQPTIENGNITNIWGHDVFTSYFMCYAGVQLGTVTTAAYQLLSNSAGKVDQDVEGNNIYGSILAVRWDQWLMGWKRRMTIETTRIARADTTEIVALCRWGMVYRDTEASAVSYGVVVA